MPGNAVVLIDGGYLNNINNKVRMSHEKLATELAKPHNLLRAYYYDCPPYQSANPSMEQRERYSKRTKFFNSLNRLPRFSVRLGRLKPCGNWPDGTPRFIQKRVDLLLGLDIADISSSGKVDIVVLLAGDGDLLPAVQAAKAKTVLVRLAYGPDRWDQQTQRLVRSYDQELWDEADERILVDSTFLSHCLL